MSGRISGEFCDNGNRDDDDRWYRYPAVKYACPFVKKFRHVCPLVLESWMMCLIKISLIALIGFSIVWLVEGQIGYLLRRQAQPDTLSI